MARSKVTDKDRGFNDLAKRIKRFNDLIVACGIHEEEGAALEDGSPLTVAQIAAIHEYGAPNADPPIPQRSWLRETCEEHSATIKGLIKKGAENVIKGANPDAEMEKIGLFVVGLIQRRIATGIPPANAQSTIDRKGSSTPLVDDGQFRQSIRSKTLPRSKMKKK